MSEQLHRPLWILRHATATYHTTVSLSSAISIEIFTARGLNSYWGVYTMDGTRGIYEGSFWTAGRLVVPDDDPGAHTDPQRATNCLSLWTINWRR